MTSDPALECSVEDVIRLLTQGELDVQGALPWGSNYTLLASVRLNGLEGLAVYKPRRGERPLWDFPRGTLCKREVATYLLSELLGWSLVPPTVLRDGPYGVGSVQLFIHADEDQHLLTMQKTGQYDTELEQLAVFDTITNNADRKSGHCLQGLDGRLWAIDHGLCFHVEYKLRTVLWNYAGRPVCSQIMRDLNQLRERVNNDASIAQAFEQLLSPAEVRAIWRRVDQILKTGKHIDVGAGRNVPWPPV
jgi:uncharacterized repeat protein (TIGR03843 family)